MLGFNCSKENMSEKHHLLAINCKVEIDKTSLKFLHHHNKCDFL